MFTTDERTANYLRRVGVEFKYRDDLYIDLEPSWKTRNDGREVPIEDEAIKDYFEQFVDGSLAPAVITVRTPHGIEVLDGVQRLVAAEQAEATRFSSYAVSPETSTAKLHVIRFGSNHSIHGSHVPDRTYILEAGVRQLYFGDHLSVAEVAKALSRNAAAIADEIAFQTAQQNILSTGYDGQYVERKKKWFPVLLSKLAEPRDWDMAPKPIAGMCKTIEQCKFTNGRCQEYVEAFFDIDRKSKKSRHDQLDRNLKLLRSEPEIAQRLAGKKHRKHLDGLLSSLKATVTIAKSSLDNGEMVVDAAFATEMAENLKVLRATFKQLVEKDLQYRGSKRTSIFDIQR